MSHYNKLYALGTRLLSTFIVAAMATLTFAGILTLSDAAALDGDHIQDATGVNTTLTNQVVRKGWGFMPGNGNFAIEDTPINYGITFDELPFLIVKFANSKQVAAGDPVDLADCSITRNVIAAGVNQTPNGFKPILRTPTGLGFPSITNYCYTWIAIGKHDASYDAGGDTTDDSWQGTTDVYTTSGNVGIGTTTPLEKVELTGNMLIRNTARNGALILSPSDVRDGYGVDPELVIQSNEPDIGSDSGFHISRNAIFRTSDDTYQYIDDAGEQATKLEFDNRGDIKFSSAGAGTGAVSFTDNMIIRNNGNVGIGTTIPASKLAVAGTIESTTGGVKYPDGTTQTSANVKQLIEDFVVASGESLTAGDVVSYFDGYVHKGAEQNNTFRIGADHIFNPSGTYRMSVAKLSSTQFVLGYSDASASSYGHLIIGNVSGTAITYGSEYVFNNVNTGSISISALSSTKFVVGFRDETTPKYGYAKIGNVVNKDAISMGNAYPFNSDTTNAISVAALSSSKFVITFRDEGNSNYGTSIIGDVSGTSITYGPEYIFNPAYSNDMSVNALSSTKYVVVFQDGNNSLYGTAIIGDVSGTAISHGFGYVFSSSAAYYLSVAALSSDKFIVGFTDTDTPDNFGNTRIGEVSGNVISYGSKYVFFPNANNITIDALSTTKFVVTFFSGAAAFIEIGDVSGTVVSYGEQKSYGNVNADAPIAALSSTKFVVEFADFYNSDTGTALIGDASSHFIGIAKESRTAGQSVPVILNGVSDVHTGLTTGDIYYSDETGALTANITDWRVGLALSSNELLLYSNFDNIDEFFNDMVFNNNFRITEAGDYEGLIFRNQLNQDILTLSEEGYMSTTGIISSKVGIGTANPNSALEVNGYIELDTVSSSPPATDCDQASERGRMKVDNVAEVLYVCVDSGWKTMQ